MARAAQSIRELLPSLWRPEASSAGLLADLIAVSGKGLDQARIDAGNTMQSHWSRFADYAPVSPFVSAFRRADGASPLLPNDPAVEEYPYIDDLARLAGLLGLAPYTDPASVRERVEVFRRRVLGTVQLWRQGVSTRAAIDAAARLALSGSGERALMVEEFAPGAALSQQAATRGQPKDMVGPLMRWQIRSRSLQDVAPDVFIEGGTPLAGEIDPTSRPLIERFDPETGTGVGLLYDGDVEPGQTLALRPTYSSWLGRETEVAQAVSVPADQPANPTAPGPWVAESGPAGTAADFSQGADGGLWLALQTPAGGEIWRKGDGSWERRFDSLPDVFALLAVGADLVIGHGTGVSRLNVFDPGAALRPDPASISRAEVRGLAQSADGTLWAATHLGAATVGSLGGLSMVGPGARAATETPLNTVMIDDDGVLYFGGELGLFRFDPAQSLWHVFSGESLDETVPDWLPWDPAGDDLPSDNAVFLPEVLSLQRGADTRLWIGTVRGLAVWGADRIRNTYATRLHAFPAMGQGPVLALATDARQLLWIGSDRGLLVHDGRDWFEEGGSGLTRLPRPATAEPGSGWRFDRASDRWEFATGTGSLGFQSQNPDPVPADNPAVHAIEWTDGALAQLGSFADGSFLPDEGTTPADLILRVKPDPETITQGGLPALPRLTQGVSHWRYLTREEAGPPEPTAFPAWTREGRLLREPALRGAPFEGRFLDERERARLDQVFAFNPAARVRLTWAPHAPFSITVRLGLNEADETLPGAVLDRVYEAANRVRPAGGRIRLALGEHIKRGEDDG